MDVLSHILTLSQAEIRLDVRCMLTQNFAVTNEALPIGEAAFHLLLAGKCHLQTSKGSVRALSAGDFVLLPHGVAHDMLDTLAESSTTRPQRAAHILTGATLPVECFAEIGNIQRAEREKTADMLCGRFIYAKNARCLMQSLPEVVHVCLRDTPGLAPLKAIIDLLREESSGMAPGGLAIVNALGQALLTLALRAYGRQHADSANLLALAADSRLGPTILAMLQDPGKAWTIAALGNMAAMSRATYDRQFQARAGMTVGEFLLRVRMMHACNLLLHSQRTLADIGESVGYQSEAAFGKAFRQLMGETPGRWRRTSLQRRAWDGGLSSLSGDE